MITNAITVTAENIDAIRDALPTDHAAELQIGCVTWRFRHESQTPDDAGTIPSGPPISR